MRPHPTLRSIRQAITLVALLAACNDSSSPITNPRVTIEDQCDPASFNAALGAGACTGTGSMTLSQFNAEPDFVASGQTFLAGAATAVGTQKYQCCIHPWMRAVVTVTN